MTASRFVMALRRNASGVPCESQRGDRGLPVDLICSHVDLDRALAEAQSELHPLLGREFEHLADLLLAEIVGHRSHHSSIARVHTVNPLDASLSTI